MYRKRKRYTPRRNIGETKGATCNRIMKTKTEKIKKRGLGIQWIQGEKTPNTERPLGKSLQRGETRLGTGRARVGGHRWTQREKGGGKPCCRQ